MRVRWVVGGDSDQRHSLDLTFPPSVLWSTGRVKGVELWLADLDAGGIEGAFSAEELGRAQRFRFARDRERWLASRRLLRRLLAARIGTDPSRLRFVSGGHGKPAVLGGPQFSVARSGRWAVFAIGESRPVGVDIELLRPPPDAEALLSSLASKEASDVLEAPRATRLESMLRCWVRKEAYLKARGVGLSLELSSFCVSVTPGRPAALLHTDPADDAQRWWLVDAPAPPGAVAAAAGAFQLAE